MGMLSGLMRRRSARTLVFSVQPADGFVGVALGTITVTGARPGATVTLTPATGSATGNTATANGSGIASFASLVLDTYAAAQTLTASAPGATDALSDAFEVLDFVTDGCVFGTDCVEGADDQVLYGTINGRTYGAGVTAQRGPTTGSNTADFSWVTEGASFDGGDMATLGTGQWRFEADDPFSVFHVQNLAANGIFSACSLNASPYSGWLFGRNSLQQLTFGFFKDALNSLGRDSDDTIPLSTWLSAAGTYDGSSSADGFALYRDGSPMASHDNSVGSFTPFSYTTQEAMIGARGTSAAFGSGMTGTQAFTLVYDRELTAAEIARNHRAAKWLLDNVFTGRGISLP